MKKFFGILQQVGQSLMLPVALLPAAGILLALGNAMQNPVTVNSLPFLGMPWLQILASYMEQAGGIIFANLALLFAVGVAVGLTAGEGVAALAAIVGFLIMNTVMGMDSHLTVALVMKAQNPAWALVLGIPTLQTGVFGGIIIGFLSASIYKRYYKIELPTYFAFFAGKRFVPIMTAVCSLILGILMSWIWPPISNGLNWFSHSMIDTNLTIASFVFGVIERSLIPFGLHHIFYNPFWYQFGSYMAKTGPMAGTLVHGDQSIFFAQLRDGVPLTAGTFMAGKFPFMMFGLPAAALAIYQEAREDRRAIVGALMLSGALTAFLTGITEPIEFSFLFVAPLLYVIHCLFAGLSFMIMHILNVHVGMTFSGGIIDFILFGIIPNRTAWWLVIPVGLCFSVIYYTGFRFAIRTFDLMTPGREKANVANNETKGQQERTTGYEQAAAILTAFGGQENIAQLNSCITRLRVEVRDISKVNKVALKDLGATGVLEIGKNIQAIYGTRAENIKTMMQELMTGSVSIKSTPVLEPKVVASSVPEVETPAVIDASFMEKIIPEGIHLPFVMPLSGKIIKLEEVPDPVFSSQAMGEGFAIIPTGNTVISPVDGVVTVFFKTKHALVVTTKEGIEVLMHVGINTVNLNGEGFDALVAVNDVVVAGQALLKFDLETISRKVTSMITPIVFPNLQDFKRNVAIDSYDQDLGFGENLIVIKNV